MRRALIALAAALLLALVAFGVTGAMVMAALRPAPGEWSVPVRVGPWRVAVGMAAALRLASHPLGLRLLATRAWATRIGTLRVTSGVDADHWRVVCDPCGPRAGSVGALPLVRVEISLVRVGQRMLKGELRAGAVRATWQAELTRDGVLLRGDLPDTPIADLYAVFGAALPELAHARITGQAGGSAQLVWPAGTWRIVPRIAGFQVDGLGTEVLRDVVALPGCAAPTRAADAAAPFGAWLPSAVIAAEDQRFYQHIGYDLVEMQAAWGTGTPRGASTLSQQLAKLVFTGDAPSATRKLREMLYAVELDRTLGKARVLQLYLSIAPWGAGRCGAQAAAEQLLKRRAAAVTPIEAAWLASLLRNPDAALARVAIDGTVDTPRVAAILDAMRPAPRRQRASWLDRLPAWSPPPPSSMRRSPLTSAGAAH